MKWTKYLGLILTGLLLFSRISTAQLKAYSFEQAEELQKNEKRNLVVFMYTDWCQYCQVMKSTALKNDKVSKMLNEQFYFVTLNGEEKRNIWFNNYSFKYKPNGLNSGTHELAAALGTIDGNISYPALVVLNSRHEIVFQYSGLLNTKAFRDLLVKLIT